MALVTQLRSCFRFIRCKSIGTEKRESENILSLAILFRDSTSRILVGPRSTRRLTQVCASPGH
jgi:hypothetical protein